MMCKSDVHICKFGGPDGGAWQWQIGIPVLYRGEIKCFKSRFHNEIAILSNYRSLSLLRSSDFLQFFSKTRLPSITTTTKTFAMALRSMTKLVAGTTAGLTLAGAAYCADQDKYFDPEALERGAKVCVTVT